MIAELERTVAMADGDLATQIGRLSAFEAKIGADLAELRNLNADTGSQGERVAGAASDRSRTTCERIARFAKTSGC